MGVSLDLGRAQVAPAGLRGGGGRRVGEARRDPEVGSLERVPVRVEDQREGPGPLAEDEPVRVVVVRSVRTFARGQRLDLPHAGIELARPRTRERPGGREIERDPKDDEDDQRGQPAPQHEVPPDAADQRRVGLVGRTLAFGPLVQGPSAVRHRRVDTRRRGRSR